jgi:hypothetical protein
MVMNWVLDKALVQGEVENNFVVDGSALVPPKLLSLQATDIDRSLTSFEIFKYHESAVRQIMKYLTFGFGFKEITRLKPPIMLKAISDGSGGYQSQKLWLLPFSKVESKKHAAFLFRVEGGDDQSGVVYSTREACATVETKWNASVHVTAIPKFPGGQAEATFERAVTAKIVWAVDPDMNISVLTGSALAEHALNLVEDAIAEDDDLRGNFDAELQSLREALPLTYKGPDDWELDPPSSVHGDEGQTTDTDVDFTAASEGMGYFAFLFSDPESPDSDEVSSIFALEVRKEGNGLALFCDH